MLLPGLDMMRNARGANVAMCIHLRTCVRMRVCVLRLCTVCVCVHPGSSALHTGHFLLVCIQRSTQPQWKACAQGSVRSSSPCS